MGGMKGARGAMDEKQGRNEGGSRGQWMKHKRGQWMKQRREWGAPGGNERQAGNEGGSRGNGGSRGQWMKHKGGMKGAPGGNG